MEKTKMKASVKYEKPQVELISLYVERSCCIAGSALDDMIEQEGDWD